MGARLPPNGTAAMLQTVCQKRTNWIPTPSGPGAPFFSPAGCFSAPCSHMLFVPFAIGFAGVHHSQPVCRCKGKWNTSGVPLHLQPVWLYGMHANPMNSERNSKSIWKKEAERCSNQTSKKEKRSPPKKLRNLKSIWAPPCGSAVLAKI